MISEFKKAYESKGGRSGAFFLYSIDRKFILKTIKKRELKILLGNFLKEYHTYIERNENSILTRILGAYSFELLDRNSIKLILMSSIYGPDNVQTLFDLKGSKLDRQTRPPRDDKLSTCLEGDLVYKDIDFLNYQKCLHLNKMSADGLTSIIESDANFLRNFYIMDYSLLVVIKKKEEFSKFFFKSASNNEKGYSLGIIDFLQKYDRSKKCETIMKKIFKMRKGMDISSINPKDYMRRFVNFIRDIIFVDVENKTLDDSTF